MRLRFIAALSCSARYDLIMKLFSPLNMKDTDFENGILFSNSVIIRLACALRKVSNVIIKPIPLPPLSA